MSSFCKCKSYSHFFSKNISIYAIFNDQSFNDTLTNDIVSVEQLGPVFLVLQEYPYQLVCLDDKYRLGQCLCDWRVFDHLYNEEYSSQLLAFWRKVSIYLYVSLSLMASILVTIIKLIDL